MLTKLRFVNANTTGTRLETEFGNEEGRGRDEEAEFANTEAKEFAQESAAVPTRITGAEVVTPDESH